MKIAVFGDVHNRYDKFAKHLNKVSNEDVDFGVQVGDMGFEPKYTNEKHLAELREASKSCDFPIHWIDGNHENHSILQYIDDFQNNPQNIFGNDLIYQSRGSYIEKDNHILLFIGGAKSIDKTERIIRGLGWHPEEEILRNQEDIVFEAIEYIKETKKDIIVFTHTCPAFDKKDEVFSKRQKPDSWQQKFLREVLDRLNPKIWCHGHFHNCVEYKIDGFETQFYSLGALFTKDDALPFYKIIEV